MANTVSLHYTEQGQGTPVVFLHGYPFSSAIWHEQQRLSDHYRVITPDLRGHGQSPTPLGVYQMDLMARDVFALLDSLTITQAIIMGHSMGGYVTLAGWQIAPERFLAMGLIATQASADSEETRQNRYKTADRVAVEGSRLVAETMLPRLFAPSLDPEDPAIDLVRNLILSTKPDGIIGALRGMAVRPDSTPLLSTVKVPTLVVCGDKDQIIPLSKGEAMAAALPSATLVTVEDAGHMLMLEQPQAATLAIRNFLSEVSG